MPDDLAAPPEQGTSLERMLRILDLVEGADVVPSAEMMAARLGFSRSTLYRYLKVLTGAGLLTALPDLGYALGPRVAQLDYRMRTTDPLIAAARPVMAELVRHEGGVALLCRRYRDQVLCVHQEAGPEAPRTSYERGRAMGLQHGAAARVILAALPAAALARMYGAHGADFAAAGLGNSLAEARAALRTIRQRGWDITAGQVTPGVSGIAAPLHDAAGAVLGSLNLTLGRASLTEPEARRLAERVMFCARIIDTTLRRNTLTGDDNKIP